MITPYETLMRMTLVELFLHIRQLEQELEDDGECHCHDDDWEPEYSDYGEEPPDYEWEALDDADEEDAVKH